MKYEVEIGACRFEFKSGLEAMHFAQMAEGSWERGNFTYPITIILKDDEKKEREENK